MSVDAQRASGPPRVPLYNRPTVRAAFYQLILLAAVLWFGYEFALNAKANLEAQKITSGFGFLENTAGFGVNQSLIPYNESDTYGRVFLVGLLNTLLVAGVGIVLATILGFLIGIARLSPNWLVARLAGGYVELIRNLPLLFQILFWYLGVLGTLPGPRQSISLFGEVFINNRGIIVPAPVVGEGAGVVFATFAVGVLAAIVLAALGEAPAGPHRPRVPAAVDQFGADHRPAACGPRCDGRPDRVCETGTPRLQFHRRGPADP